MKYVAKILLSVMALSMSLAYGKNHLSAVNLPVTSELIQNTHDNVYQVKPESASWLGTREKVQKQIVDVANKIPVRWDCNSGQISHMAFSGLTQDPKHFKDLTTGMEVQDLMLSQNHFLSENIYSQLYPIFQRDLGNHVFDVNTSSRLIATPGFVEEHIPSVDRIQKLVQYYYSGEDTNVLKNISDNTSVMTLTDDMHRAIHEHHIKEYETMSESVINTLTDEYVYLQENKPELLDTFIKSSILLYYRDKTLCLFLNDH